MNAALVLLVSLVVHYVLDQAYFSYHAADYAPLLRSVRRGPAVAGYALMSLVIYQLVTARHGSVEASPDWWKDAAWLALAMYGVYHFTNWATLPSWTERFVLIDGLWGIAVTVLLAYVQLRAASA